MIDAGERTAIWADVDTGVDDALALLYLVRSPRVELVGVSAVAGNVSVEQAARNTLAVLDAVGADAVPVHLGASKPLLGSARDATGFHGAAGLGATVPPPSDRRPHDVAALDALRRAVSARPGEITLLALGPLTTVAQFVSGFPEEAALLRGIIAMTGAVAGGNATATAEFNCWQDPEAVQIVVESPVAVTIFPLDRFPEATLPETIHGEWRGATDSARSLGAGLLEHCTPAGGGRSWLGDGAVAVVAARSDLATVQTYPVEVDLSRGPSRGTILVDRRNGGGEAEQHGGSRATSLVGVVTSVDRDALAVEYVAALSDV